MTANLQKFGFNSIIPNSFNNFLTVIVPRLSRKLYINQQILWLNALSDRLACKLPYKHDMDVLSLSLAPKAKATHMGR